MGCGLRGVRGDSPASPIPVRATRQGWDFESLDSEQDIHILEAFPVKGD